MAVQAMTVQSSLSRRRLHLHLLLHLQLLLLQLGRLKLLHLQVLMLLRRRRRRSMRLLSRSCHVVGLSRNSRLGFGLGLLRRHSNLSRLSLRALRSCSFLG